MKIDDERQIKYWVQRNQDSQWMKENQIKNAEDFDCIKEKKGLKKQQEMHALIQGGIPDCLRD
jgi:hypothetical protein